jgi:hypothetical protein
MVGKISLSDHQFQKIGLQLYMLGLIFKKSFYKWFFFQKNTFLNPVFRQNQIANAPVENVIPNR